MSSGLQENSLAQAVTDHPYLDFHDWWPIGNELANFMASAICKAHNALPGAPTNDKARSYYQEYIRTVFDKDARLAVFDAMIAGEADGVASGEFDSFSYAFYRSAFEHIAAHASALSHPVPQARRLFTKVVGKHFFARVADFIELTLPEQLQSPEEMATLQAGIANVGGFLKDQGYLRDHFGFYFDVQCDYKSTTITQSEADVLPNIQKGCAYALYEMGYPVILPSAVYLYQTIGEAQHHSSRTIEDLFERVGLAASEVSDFDPRDYPSDKVVELWEITPLTTEV